MYFTILSQIAILLRLTIMIIVGTASFRTKLIIGGYYKAVHFQILVAWFPLDIVIESAAAIVTADFIISCNHSLKCEICEYFFSALEKALAIDIIELVA